MSTAAKTSTTSSKNTLASRSLGGALCLIKNPQERLAMRPMFTDYENLVLPKTLEEVEDHIQALASAQLVVLDENMGEPHLILERIQLLPEGQRPWVLILVKERDDGPESWRAEMERLQQYSQIGGEFFLHRPFGMVEFKAKIDELSGWISSPPPWISLLRASRALMKNDQSDKIVSGLQFLYSKKNDDVHLALFLVEALKACHPPRLEDAVKVLQELDSRVPTCTPVLESLAQVQESLENYKGALNVRLKLCAVSDKDDYMQKSLSLMRERFQIRSEDFRFWADLMNLFPKKTDKQMELRKVLVEHVAELAASDAEISEYLDILKLDPELAHETVKFTVDTFERHNLGHQALRSKDLLFKLAEAVLDVDVSNPAAIEYYSKVTMEIGNWRSLENRLRRMRVAGRMGFEYHTGMAEVAMAQAQPGLAHRFLTNAQPMARGEDRIKRFQDMMEKVQLAMANAKGGGTQLGTKAKAENV